MEYTTGARLREARERKGFTLKEVAKSIKLAEGTIQRHESGAIRNIKLATFKKYGECYGVNWEYLAGWSDTHKFLSPIVGEQYVDHITNKPTKEFDDIMEKMKEYSKYPEILKAYDELTDEGKKYFIGQLEIAKKLHSK